MQPWPNEKVSGLDDLEAEGASAFTKHFAHA